jgi:hypothetical protein
MFDVLNVFLLLPTLAATLLVYVALEWLIWRAKTQPKRVPILVPVRDQARRPGDDG